MFCAVLRHFETGIFATESVTLTTPNLNAPIISAIGASGGGTVTLNVTGTTNIDKIDVAHATLNGGTVNLNGGIFNVYQLFASGQNGGTVNITAGTSNVTELISRGVVTGGIVNINANTVTGAVIDVFAGLQGGTININGVDVTINSLIATSGGTINVNSNNMNISYADVSGINGGVINLQGNNLNFGALNVVGGVNGGTLNVTANNTLIANSIHGGGGVSAGVINLYAQNGGAIHLVDLFGGGGFNGVLNWNAPNGFLVFGGVHGGFPGFAQGPTSTGTGTGSSGLPSVAVQTITVPTDAFVKLQTEVSAALDGQLKNEMAAVNTFGTRISTDVTPNNAQNSEQDALNNFQANPPQPLQGGVLAYGGGTGNAGVSGPGNGSASAHIGQFNDQVIAALKDLGISIGPGSGGAFFNLDKGSILFVPTSDITVGTHEGQVQIPAGAVAYIVETGNDVAVYNLHDKSGGVTVKSGRRTLTLAPGEQLVLTRKPNAPFGEVNPVQDVAYRNVQGYDFGDGIYGHLGEFSHTSAIGSVSMINSMLRSSVDRKTAQRLLKTAASLQIVKRGSEPFHTATKLSGKSGTN